MKNLVLVDTCIWIDFIKKAAFKKEIATLSRHNRLATCGLVRSELFPFMRKQKAKFEALFDKMTSINFEESFWPKLIYCQEKIIKKGHNPYNIPDLIILVLCIENEMALLTKDKGFKRIADLFDLKLF